MDCSDDKALRVCVQFSDYTKLHTDAAADGRLAFSPVDHARLSWHKTLRRFDCEIWLHMMKFAYRCYLHIRPEVLGRYEGNKSNIRRIGIR